LEGWGVGRERRRRKEGTCKRRGEERCEREIWRVLKYLGVGRGWWE
jgi:hypothetical protein